MRFQAAPTIRVLRRVAVMGVAIAAVAITAAAPAHAADGAAPSGTYSITTAAEPLRSLGDCPANYACLWPGTNWTGSFRWQGTNVNTPVGNNINNKSRSSANWSDSRVACLWDNDNGTGDHLSEGPHSIRADLRQDQKPSGGSWDHKISALTWNNC